MFADATRVISRLIKYDKGEASYTEIVVKLLDFKINE